VRSTQRRDEYIMNGEYLLFVGTVVMVLSLVAGLVMAILLRRNGKRLREQQEIEFGHPHE